VRGYTVYNHEIRTGRNVKQLILRASQFAKSEPQGPAYLIASRECLEERITSYEVDATKWKPIAPIGLSLSSVEQIANALLGAKRPVIVTTYLGRDMAAVPELVQLCEKLGIAVLVSGFNSSFVSITLLTKPLGSCSGLHELSTQSRSLCRQSLE
jgi:acetolactate synthase-1/2/3 large subunit